MVTQVSDLRKVVFIIVLRGSEDTALPALTRLSVAASCGQCLNQGKVRAKALGARGQKPATRIGPNLFYIQLWIGCHNRLKPNPKLELFKCYSLIYLDSNNFEILSIPFLCTIPFYSLQSPLFLQFFPMVSISPRYVRCML